MKPGGSSGLSLLERIRASAMAGPPVDKDGLPSLSDYTPQPPWKEELKTWISIIVIAIAIIIIVPLTISACLAYLGSINGTLFTAGTVSVSQPAADTILVMYDGGSGAGNLLYLNGTITTSSGEVQSKELKSVNAAAPLEVGSYLNFTGDFYGSDRVVVVGFYEGNHWVSLADTNL